MSGKFNLQDYIPVQERINEFWQRHPGGNIVTTLESDPSNFDICRYRAEVYRDQNDTRPASTGWAFEIAGKGMANQTSHEENCETSAIGRALANLGMATSHSERPSREEMGKVERKQTSPQTRQDAPSAANERTEDMATPKQITFAYKLARQVGVSDDEMQDAATRLYGTPVEYLSKRDASAFIERMQAGDISTGTRQNEPPPAPRGTTITKGDADEVRADAEAAGWTSADLNNWLGKRGLARMGAMTYAQRDDLRRDIRAMSDAALEPVEVEA